MAKWLVLLAMLAAAFLLPSTPTGSLALPHGPCDFDNDGFDDLAFASQFENLGAVDAGAVNVIYGTATRLRAAGNQLWHQNSPGILDSNEPYEYFGWDVTCGDFDGDGFSDLASGVPFETPNSDAFVSGAVSVIYGSAGGLAPAGNELWHQNDPGIPEDAEFLDSFGRAVESGDFNGDTFADLAIGVPYEYVGNIADAGAVNVIYGSAAGLRSNGSQLWHQNSFRIVDSSEQFDRFGVVLSSGDFNGDGYQDLAVGLPFENIGAVDAGAVQIIYGTASGLRAAGNQIWHQNSAGVADTADPYDYFGAPLTSGDFDADGLDDLAVGVINEDYRGAVATFYGASTGLTASRNHLWHQDSTNMLDTAEFVDGFGGGLASADFNGDLIDDLAIGVPGEDISGVTDAGAMQVIYGVANAGLRAAGNQLWHQNSPNVKDAAEASDYLGVGLQVGDFNGDGFADLAIGSARENLGPAIDACAVNVLYGSAGRLTAAGNQFWHQNSLNVLEVAESYDCLFPP